MGILTRTLSDGSKRYDVRCWYKGKSFFKGGFTTRDAAKKALREVMGDVDTARLGTPEPVAPFDPTIRELMGNPDNEDKPGAGTFLEEMSRPGVAEPSYYRRLRVAARPLLAFFADLHVSELSRDKIREYQRIREESPLRVGEANRKAGEARRRERWERYQIDIARRRALGLPLPRGRRLDDPAAAANKAGPATRTVATSTINREVMTLRSCLHWASHPDREAACRVDCRLSFEGLAKKEPEALVPDLRGEDQVRLINACKPPWLRDLVVVMLGSGLRSGEALALTCDNVNVDERRITVESSKTDNPRKVPVSREALAVLEARRDRYSDGPLFRTAAGNPITSGKAASAFRPVAVKLGLKQRRDGKLLTLHSLRHSFASRLIGAGAALPAVADALGHRGLSSVTKRYVHTKPEELEALIDRAADSYRPTPAIVRREGEAG